MFFGNLVLVIGAILTATANSSGRFLGGRFLTGERVIRCQCQCQGKSDPTR